MLEILEKNVLTLEHKKQLFTVCYYLQHSNKGATSYENNLSPWESEYHIKLSAKRQEEFSKGRYLAKKALQEITPYAKKYAFEEISIGKGIFGYPVICNNHSGCEISLSHRNGYVIAAAYPNQIMLGVDIEEIDSSRHPLTLEGICSPKEIKMIAQLPLEHDPVKVIWVCKEALGKCLKIGLSSGMTAFCLEAINKKEDLYWIDFKQYRQFTGFIKIWRGSVYAVVFPKKLELKDWVIMEVQHEI